MFEKHDGADFQVIVEAGRVEELKLKNLSRP